MASAPLSNSSTSVWKGKAKATQNDLDELNPTITYRHILSQNTGVRNPLRVVALCDSDAFYAHCEQVRLGLDPELPLVVQQWESLIAVNYPARKFGITRMEKIKDAKKRCPNLVVVHVATYKEGAKEPGYWENPDSFTHKVSLDHYRRESAKILNEFKAGLPDGEIEKASIDEAFIDFTVPVRNLLLARFPYLGEVPPDAPDGIDSPLPPPPPIDWTGLGEVIPVTPVKTSSAGESNSEDGGTHDEDEALTTWHDVALSIAAELMDKIRKDVHAKLGYSTSAGIARNKFLAKLTASYKKPNGQSILRNAAIANYLHPMAFQKIRFLGGKLGKAIAEKYDASTVGDLLDISLEDMQNRFGEESIWVYEILRGIDRSEVKEKPAITKSMLASKNLQHPVVKPSQGHHWIRVLAAELSLRLNEARETIPGIWPKTIALHVKESYQNLRSKQAPFPFIRDVTTDVITAAGDKLWKELVGVDSPTRPAIKITGVQLSFHGLESLESGQRSIEGFFKADSSDNTDITASKRKREDDQDNTLRDLPESSGLLHGDVQDDETFTCSRCRKRIVLSDHAEHEDFHVAQDLSRSLNKSSSPSKISVSSTKEPKGKKSKGTGDKGIAKFFERRDRD